MSHSSDILVNLGYSKVYVRLVLTCYVITISLICYSPTYYVIKCVLSILLLGYFLTHFKIKSPCPSIHTIRLFQNKWVLIGHENALEQYDEANIIIHNVLFQLIKLTSPNQQKLLVIFNDQITQDELRLMHLKIATAPNL